MLRIFIIILVSGLAGCDAAGTGFRGVDGVQQTVEGSRFTLRFRDNLVEAVRTSPEMLPKFEDVARKAAIAAEGERPGCKTAWAEGDPSIVLLGLACNGEKAPKKPKRSKMLACDLMQVGVSGRADLTCTKS